MEVGQLNASIRDIPIPEKMQRLPVSDRGFPVPWFVAHVNGNWDFRVIAPGKIFKAYHEQLCWLCGGKLGQYLAFTIGPMCTINRTTSEPPSHLVCAQYAVAACPFLSNARMRRNEVELPDHPPIPGLHLADNPGAAAIWITKHYEPFQAKDGTLFSLGDPINVLWYHDGRPATRGEVLEAIYKRLPRLRVLASKEGAAALMELDRFVIRALNLIPKETDDAGQIRPQEHFG